MCVCVLVSCWSLVVMCWKCGCRVATVLIMCSSRVGGRVVACPTLTHGWELHINILCVREAFSLRCWRIASPGNLVFLNRGFIPVVVVERASWRRKARRHQDKGSNHGRVTHETCHSLESTLVQPSRHGPPWWHTPSRHVPSLLLLRASPPFLTLA